MVDPPAFARRLPDRELRIDEFRELIDGIEAESVGSVGGPQTVVLFYIVRDAGGAGDEIYIFDEESEEWRGWNWDVDERLGDVDLEGGGSW